MALGQYTFPSLATPEATRDSSDQSAAHAKDGDGEIGEAARTIMAISGVTRGAVPSEILKVVATLSVR